MTAELKRAELKRNGLRLRCKALCEGIRRECNKEVDEITWTRLQAKVQCLQDYEEDLNALNRIIDSEADEDYLEKRYAQELEDTEKFVVMIKETYLMVNKMTEVRSVKDSNEEKSSKTSEEAEAGKKEAPKIKREKVAVRLPVLDVPTFRGEFINFTPFIQAFESTIDNNEQLSQLDKFNYLRTMVKGEALEVIKPLPVTEQNYQLAMQRLKDRFGRPENLINAHIQSVWKLKRIKDMTQFSEIKELVNELEFHISALQGLKVEPVEYNRVFFCVVAALVPGEILKTMDRLGLPAKVDSLLVVLKEEVSRQYRCEAFEFKQLEGEKQREKPQRVFRTTTALHMAAEEDVTSAAVMGVAEMATSTVNKNSGWKPYCALCKGMSHWTDQCDVKRSWEEKFALLTEAGRCYRCAARGHRARECNYRRAVCDFCEGKHFSVLCPNPERRSAPEVTSMTIQLRPDTQYRGKILLQTAHILLSSVRSEKERDVRALLDGGSQCSFITEEVARDMRLSIVDRESIKLNTIGGMCQRYECNRVLVPLFNRQREKVTCIQALAVPQLAIKQLPYPEEETKKMAAEHQLNLADRPILGNDEYQGELEMLIGADYYWEIVGGEQIDLGKGLMAVNSKLGWLLQGPQLTIVQEPRCDEWQVTFITKQQEYDDLKRDIEKIWELDAILVPELKGKEIADKAVLDIKRDEQGYSVSLPWRSERKENLENNSYEAQRRLHSLIRRLTRQPGMIEAYHQAVMNYIKEGHAKVVPSHNVREKGYYMPHRPVIRQGTTTDLRVVFDASAKAGGNISLNDCLWPGEDRHLDVVGTLLRFRLHEWAMVADIRKAFLQIKVEEKDWDYLRFLWLNPESEVREPYDIVEFCMTRVTFGVNASPFILRSVLKHHLELFRPKMEAVVDDCVRNMYVDDLVLSVISEEKVIDYQDKTQSMFGQGGFELRKWATNSPKAFDSWKERGVEIVTQGQIKVLGVMWDIFRDELMIQLPDRIFVEEGKLTKRGVIKTIASVFDPLGVLSAVVVKAKMLFQRLWKMKFDWDDVISDEEFLREWGKWINEIRRCQDVVISRWGGFMTSRTIELHAFNDASPQAFGAALWLRVIDCCEESKLFFVIARYRVAPLKEKSLPQLELLSAEMAATLADYWKRETGVTPYKSFFWTDSEIVLNWITGDKVRDNFVEPKVRVIRSLTDATEWRHCPGAINPADFGTRKEKEMNSEIINEWLEGPDWLKAEEKWPYKYVEQREEVVAVVEIEKSQEQEAMSTYGVLPGRSSSWPKIIRGLAWIIRFTDKCRHATEIRSKQLMAEEMKTAKRAIIKLVQRKWFSKEIKCVTEGKPVLRKSMLNRFQLEMDSNGVLRIKSRFMGGLGVTASDCPIVLPGKDPVVKLIIKDRHESLLHVGVNTVLADLRQDYWITKGRVACKRVLRECLLCQRHQGKPFMTATGKLPEGRCRPSAAFVNIGIDFAGPCYINSRGISSKVYVLLITCLYSRAVHLELVSDLSTERFVLAFQRFMARRGQPTTIYSDNAQTFKKAKRIMQGIVEYGVQLPRLSFFKWDTTVWKFSVERAPWMGGVWERMVQTVKRILRKVIGNAELSFEELGTLLAVIESVVNSRPLTLEQTEPGQEQVVTPNHLITGRSLKAFPIYEGEQVSHDLQVLQRYAYLQRILQHFSNRWVKEYVTLLRSNHEGKSADQRVPIVGEVVLIKLDNAKRHLYPMGKIEKLNYGRDGCVRSAMLRVSSGRILCRPLNLLYPLETNAMGGPEC